MVDQIKQRGAPDDTRKKKREKMQRHTSRMFCFFPASSALFWISQHVPGCLYLLALMLTLCSKLYWVQIGGGSPSSSSSFFHPWISCVDVIIVLLGMALPASFNHSGGPAASLGNASLGSNPIQRWKAFYSTRLPTRECSCSLRLASFIRPTGKHPQPIFILRILLVYILHLLYYYPFSFLP